MLQYLKCPMWARLNGLMFWQRGAVKSGSCNKIWTRAGQEVTCTHLKRADEWFGQFGSLRDKSAAFTKCFL